MGEIDFRDGKHWVPDHVEALIGGLPVHTMTVAEAIKAANDRLVGDRLFQAQQRLINDHFDARRRGE